MRPPPERPREPEPYRCNHILHLLLSIITMGLWVIVWLITWAAQHDRHMLQVDRYRRAHEQWVSDYAVWSGEYYDHYGVPAPVMMT